MTTSAAGTIPKLLSGLQRPKRNDNASQFPPRSSEHANDARAAALEMDPVNQTRLAIILAALSMTMASGCIGAPGKDPAVVEPAALASLAVAHSQEIEAPIVAEVPPPPENAIERWAHIRLWDVEGTLLHSTQEGENGTLTAADPDLTKGAAAWPRMDTWKRPIPMWDPLLPMLARAPPNATLRIEDYAVPETRLEDVIVPKALYLAKQGALPKEKAEAVLGNVTPGARRLYLGVIPVEVTGAEDGAVFYSFDFDAPQEFAIPRIVGLNVTATPLQNGTVRFELVVPEEGFTAHNNCQVLEKFLTFGYYRVMEETADSLHLARYGSRVEYVLAHETIDIEFSFIDNLEAPTVADATHDHH